VQIGYVRPLHASISILALSASLFLLHNFARIFGTEGHAVLSRLGLDGILQSDMTQYFLYAIFLSEILGTKLMETRKA
jgi:hypothetical protein